MKVGLQIPQFKWPGSPQNIGSKLVQIARTAEEAGFYSVWVMDHYFQLDPMIGPADDPMLEGYSALSFLAAVTQRVKLGTLVSGVIYRSPAYLIKSVTNLDVLSGGRAYFGVGAAWYEREAVGLGFEYPSTKKRFELLEDTLKFAHHVWSGNREPFEGQHVRAPEPILSPPALSDPHPPIMIGGTGEKKTLRFVAQYADACNIFIYQGTDFIRHKLDVLRGHCDALGRDYEEIERTSLGTVHIAPGQMSADDVIALCQDLADVGIQHAIFNMPNTHEIAPLETFGETIIPAVMAF